MGSPEAITTDDLRSQGAAVTDLGNRDRRKNWTLGQQQVRELTPSFRRRARAIVRYRQMKTLQKFASIMPMSTPTSIWIAPC